MCEAADGLCAVCYFWRRMPVYCLLFYFVCRTVECLCTACYFFFCVDGCLVFALLFQRKGIKFKNSLF